MYETRHLTSRSVQTRIMLDEQGDICVTFATDDTASRIVFSPDEWERIARAIIEECHKATGERQRPLDRRLGDE